MTTPTDKYLGEFRLGRQLTTPGQVLAVGLAVLIGLAILFQDGLISLAGNSAPLTGLLVSGALGLTLMSVVEMIGGSGEHGGTYILVNETLGGVTAFLTGWAILIGSLALCAGLILLSTDLLLTQLGLQFEPVSTALALVSTLILLQLFQFLPRRLQLRTVVAILAIAIFAWFLSDLVAIPATGVSMALRTDPSVITRAVAFSCAGYAVFEAMLSSRRQMREPVQMLPIAVLYGLIALAVLLTGISFVAAQLNVAGGGEGGLISILLQSSILPIWMPIFIALSALLLAANGCLMIAARQVYNFSRNGAFPRILRRVWEPIPMPLLLFAVLAMFVAPLIIMSTSKSLANLAASMYLASMTALNLAAIYSHRNEPDRRRAFKVPFSPLVPALAIAVNLILLRYLPGSSLLSGGLWLLGGAIYYFGYARSQQMEAQKGEIVFGRGRPREGRREAHRILVPIGPGEERHIMLGLSTSLAHQVGGEVIPLQVIAMPDPLAIEEGRRTARERNTLFQWSTRLADDLGVPMFPITRLARNVSEGIIDTAIEEECDLILMSWALKKGAGQTARIGSILGHVTREAPCDVAVVAYHPEHLHDLPHEEPPPDQNNERPTKPRTGRLRFHPTRILVPTSGGPNAPLATHLSLLLAREHAATVTAIYVTHPESSPDEIAAGDQRIQETLSAMKAQLADLKTLEGLSDPQEQAPIEGQVITSANVVSGIAETGSDYDLVFIGASEESLIDQVLFGSIPERVALECNRPVVIVRRYRGLPRLWLKRAWNTLNDALPTVDREEQILIYRDIHRGARPDVDFFVMIGLSTLIATFGLLQNSTAVIIGAMLVAPLFSPIIALSLSVVQGNIRLLRLAIESTLKGIFLAVGLAATLAALSPLLQATPEIITRTQPGLFDLAVALASGAAGAYAVARKDVATALPGVAIAAALVPPLSVIGVGLAMGDLSIAGGGGLLFTTNLVAIALAGALIFLLLGFRPGGHGERDVTLRRGLTVTIVLFLLVSIPLAVVFSRSVSASRTRRIIQSTLVEALREQQVVELASPESITVKESGGELVVTVPLYAHADLPDTLAQQLSDALSEKVGNPVRVRILSTPLIEAQP